MTTLTVTQVNKYIKALLEEVPQTRNIYVAGEISNFKHYTKSGHMYFTLKDSSSQLKCVMFSFDNSKLKFMPEDGMNVVCFGQVSVYERDGVYQLYVHGMQPKGVGALTVAYEQLKEKLSAKGYFDESVKKAIPKYPEKVGVATSNMGAAVEDIKNVISRRYPLCEIIISPTVVQGDEAAPSIVKSIELLDSLNLDVIIVGRGGGSIEDLWAFNTEAVANAVYNCKAPIISAVGHETDFTICDFVADVRAATPSAAAELAVPDIKSEYIYLENLKVDLEKAIDYKLQFESNKLENMINNSLMIKLNEFFEKQNSILNEYTIQIARNCKNIVENKSRDLSRFAGMLNALSPLAVLARGYSITKKDGKVISDKLDVSKGDKIDISTSNLTLKATIDEVI